MWSEWLDCCCCVLSCASKISGEDGVLTATEALFIELEFARAESTDDPEKFRLGRQIYLFRDRGTYSKIELSWDETFLKDLTDLRRSGRDAVLQQEFGNRLRQFLNPTHWQVHEAEIIKAGFCGQRVILTIRSSASELYALPWELLTVEATGQHIGELPNVLVRYEWPATETKPKQLASYPARRRVMMAWSAAAGAVPAAEHIQAIQQACRAGRVSFDYKVDVVQHVSLTRLRAALDSAQESGSPITILHLLCHGSRAGKSFGLAFNSDSSDGETVVVDGGRLRQILEPFAAQLRLVVLMACDGSNPGELGNQLGSVAQNLHRVGFAAVVASRYPLATSASETFTKIFYDALIGRHLTLEHVIPIARRRMAEDASRADWASLQLFARAADEPGLDSSPQRQGNRLIRFRWPFLGIAMLLAASSIALQLVFSSKPGRDPVGTDFGLTAPASMEPSPPQPSGKDAQFPDERTKHQQPHSAKDPHHSDKGTGLKNCLIATSFFKFKVNNGQAVYLNAYESNICNKRGWSSNGVDFGGPLGIANPHIGTKVTASASLGALVFYYSEENLHSIADVIAESQHHPIYSLSKTAKNEIIPYDSSNTIERNNGSRYMYLLMNDIFTTTNDNAGSIKVDVAIDGRQIELFNNK